jgi:ABC-type transport system involved in cytochrome c biogenesis permease subunit
MYLHVPAAWMATFVYGVMTVAALGTLVWRHPLADAAQKAAAPRGAGFTFICLVTGSLWGKPMSALIGCGRPPDSSVGAVHSLSRSHCLVARD